jgi:APA family basic amino acid/polyamine antiporter
MRAMSSLARVVRLPGAVLLGLGSIVGTGIFVGIGTAADIAGASVLVAVAIGALVATCNGLSSAQLAAAHPVSGGTYEYGYRYASPLLGRTAGWMFVTAKSASAATAALGFGGYALALVDAGDRTMQIGLGFGAVVVLTWVVAGGMKRSNTLNLVIVGLTLASLGAFVVAGIPHVDAAHFSLGDANARDIAHASALVFVAYTGYGRIATLGEEVHEPARTIPRAIITTLVVSLLLYLAVTAIAVGSVGGDGLAAATRATNAPLEAIATAWDSPARYAVAVGAITAMLGVILNLVLGISRVVLAMARRGDLPRRLAEVHGSSPRAAVIVTGAVIAGLALVGSINLAWSVSAFTVLVYYAITNWCALRLPPADRRFPRAIAVVGLIACVALAVGIVVGALL